MIVADTNLVAYLLIEGPPSAACRQVLAKDPAWVAPSFWRVEFANVLTNYVRFKKWPGVEARRLWEASQALPFLTSLELDPGACIETAAQTGLSLYDALYVELARKIACPLITFDKACIQAAPGLALSVDAFLRSGAGPKFH